MSANMDIFDLSENFNKTIKLAKGEEKTFFWRLFLPEKFSGEIAFELADYAKLKNVFIFYASKSNEYNINMTVNHIGKHSSSDTYISGIGRGMAKVKVMGAARAEKEARHSNIWLDGRALLFEDANCRIDPRLEIKTSEVDRAGHASTVSRVSDENIFYMETRGVTRFDAEKLQSGGFLSAPLLRAGLSLTEAEKIIEPVFNYV